MLNIDWKIKNYKGAILDYDKAILLNPKFVSVFNSTKII